MPSLIRVPPSRGELEKLLYVCFTRDGTSVSTCEYPSRCVDQSISVSISWCPGASAR